MMLYWLDKTDYLKLEKEYNEEKNVIMLIQVDGYDEVLKSASERRSISNKLRDRKMLTSLENNTKGALKRTSKDKFILIMNKKELNEIEESKFAILDKIRDINHGNGLPVTISMGIGIDGDT